jgi:UDP-3-O-[3-hydroxymyristoyl] N-acetylglucosamine deacetylase
MGGGADGIGQTTLRERVSLRGIGVHSGAPTQLTLCPADDDTGIVFMRTDLAEGGEIEIPARSEGVCATELCTTLGSARASVATVEHLLAALSGLGVDNALIEIDAAEVPVMDGSARAFVEAIEQGGVVARKAPRRLIKVLRPVRVSMGAANAEFEPYDGRRFEVSIDYDCAVIGRQRIAIDLTADRFRTEIAPARTYGLVRDVERLWAEGYALGSSLENSVAVGDDAVLNPEGLRFPDEFVRHKVLDALGDLALAGMPIEGLYRSHRGGHRLNAAALAALFAEPEAWAVVTRAESAPRAERRADLAAGAMPAPAFAPELR